MGQSDRGELESERALRGPVGLADELWQRALSGYLHDLALPRSERTVDKYFNTGAGFNTNSAQQLASNYRTFPQYLTGARNPGWNDWSISPIKSFPLKERLSFELRGQFTNAFNHPNFGGPNLSPTSANFGRSRGQLSPHHIRARAVDVVVSC